MKSILKILLLITLIANISVAEVNSEDMEDLIIITVDSMGLEDLEGIDRDYATGMLSMKSLAQEDNMESQLMSISVGRRVELKNESFKGIDRTGKSASIIEYENILRQLDEEYDNFSKDIPFLGESLKMEGISRSYIGNDMDVLLLSDKDGQIDYVSKGIVYTEDWLEDEVDHMLNISDILHISYDIEDNLERLGQLKSLIESRDERIILVSKSVPSGMDRFFNDTLVPVFSVGESEGLLSSRSTNRQGLVSDLDIMPTVLSHFDIGGDILIGEIIKSDGTSRGSLEIEDIFEGFLSLNLSKYIFHGLIILSQILILLQLFLKKKIYILKFLLFFPSSIILFSIIAGLLGIYRNPIIYILAVTILSILLSKYLCKKRIYGVENIGLFTNVLIIMITIFSFENIYNSFIGYNNIVAGGRFYGYNNDIMGVLLGTTIISYFYVKDRFSGVYGFIFTALYLPIIVVMNSSVFGNNFGGLISSIFMVMVIVYFEYLKGKCSFKRTLISLLSIGIISGFILYMLASSGHIGDFFNRVRIYGLVELADMIKTKLRQLLFMTVVPPWSLMIILQSIYAIRHIKKTVNERYGYRDVILFATAVFVAFINDTGAISFVYIMTYFLSKTALEYVEEE